MGEISQYLAGVVAAFGVILVLIAVLMPNVVTMEDSFTYWNYVGIGAGLVVLSGFSILAQRKEFPGKSLAALVTIPVGAWIVLLPFYTPQTVGWLPWLDVLLGIFVMIVGIKNAWAAIDPGPSLGPSGAGGTG